MAYYKDLKKDYRYPAGNSVPGQSGWIARHLKALRTQLFQEIRGQRHPNSLIIGSWNIKHFDGGRPRLPESFHYIAEIIDHFDICALQEVKNVWAVEKIMDLLGPDWAYFINDSSDVGRGNHERMAYLYNTNKVRFRNLIGELTFDQRTLTGIEPVSRTPFFASFQAGWFRFTLCSAHIASKDEAGRPSRAEEIGLITEELAKRAGKQDEVYIFLGDMNTDNRQHAAYQKFAENGFDVPDFPPTNSTGKKFFDLIAFTGPEDVSRRLRHGAVGFWDSVFTDAEKSDYEPFSKAMKGRTLQDPFMYWAFFDKVRDDIANGTLGPGYADWDKEYSSWRTDEMSDHLPVWIELETDYSDDYLDRFVV
ncbi:MAG: endonuclease/exonuclease/phosphatase family protein [Pseudomonadota bacterium]